MDEPTKIADLEYARVGETALLLDLDLPDAAPPYPLIVWIHGGGWRDGSKEDRPLVRAVDDALLAHGYAIASINYRLSGEAAFPAQLADCRAAVRWLRAHAVDYQLDAAHIGVWGFSSGGHLAALLATSA